jgi:hypothetical protein
MNFSAKNKCKYVSDFSRYVSLLLQLQSQKKLFFVISCSMQQFTRSALKLPCKATLFYP